MPQIFNLGGFTLQKTKEARINLLRSRDMSTPYMEVNMNDDGYTANSVFLRNIKEIRCSDGVTTIQTERIKMS